MAVFTTALSHARHAQDEGRQSHRPPWMMTSFLQYEDLTVMPDELKSAATNSAAHAGIWRQEKG